MSSFPGAPSSPAVPGGYPSPTQARVDFTMVQLATVKTALVRVITEKEELISLLASAQPPQQQFVDQRTKLENDVENRLKQIQMQDLPAFTNQVSSWGKNEAERIYLHLPDKPFPDTADPIQNFTLLNTFWTEDMSQNVKLGDIPVAAPFSTAFFAGRREEARELLCGQPLIVRLAQIDAEEKALGV